MTRTTRTLLLTAVACAGTALSGGGAGAAEPTSGPDSASPAPAPAVAVVPGTTLNVDDEVVRRFYEAGPVLLLPKSERERLAAAPPEERARVAAELLARDPDPSTPANELILAIQRRRNQILSQGLSFYDERAQLLFLLGPPAERHKVECGDTYRPLELWSWGAPLPEKGEAPPGARIAIATKPRVGGFFKIWRPTDSKRPLYTEEIEYLLEQFEELKGRITGKRPDLYLCKDARRVDDLTGVDGLFGFRKDRMHDADVDALFAPPADLGAWSRDVLGGEPDPKPLPLPTVSTSFKKRPDQRMAVWVRVQLPQGVELGQVEQKSGKESRLALHVALDRPEAIFEEFDVRFVFPPVAPGIPIFLEFEKPLRAQQRFLARFELRDEISGAKVVFDRAIDVPIEATPEPAPVADAKVGQVLGLAQPASRAATVLLLPPADDVVFGLWRAEAIVAGDQVAKVVFLVDGKLQLARTNPPWTAELRISNTPKETVVRVEALDAEGKTIAADEVLLNEPQGEARVKLLAPPRGQRVAGKVKAKAAVVTPSGGKVESVEFKLNDASVAKLEMPPWEATVVVPESAGISYLTVIATYADGTTAEDLRVLNSNEMVEEIQVDLVEVYAAVFDRDGKAVDGLTQADFQVLDNGKAQEISKFEVVRGMPLTLGLVLDTSGSMEESMADAKQAAAEFVDSVLTPKDRTFAVAFSERPQLLLPLTSDAKAIQISFRDLPAMGSTSLHDALIYSLYQFRGIRGQKALVLLSDGDDTSSKMKFEDALSYAQRAGVAIYTIGLKIGGASVGIRGKLEKLASETGGRVFFVDKASELAGVYDRIEEELRSRYLVAFAPNPIPKEGERHALEVKVGGGKWKARAAKGYTP